MDCQQSSGRSKKPCRATTPQLEKAPLVFDFGHRSPLPIDWAQWLARKACTGFWCLFKEARSAFLLRVGGWSSRANKPRCFACCGAIQTPVEKKRHPVGVAFSGGCSSSTGAFQPRCNTAGLSGGERGADPSPPGQARPAGAAPGPPGAGWWQRSSHRHRR